METLRKVFANRYFVLAVELLFALATAVASIYYIHASVIVRRVWKLVLIDLTYTLSAAVLFMLCYTVKHPDGRLIYALIYFFAGAAAFSLLFYPVQAVVASLTNTTVAATAGVIVALSFTLACIVYHCIPAFRTYRRFETICLALVLLVVQAGSVVLSFSQLPHGWAFKKFSNTVVSFDVASAEELSLTDEEKTANRAWYEDYVLHAVQNGKTPAYDFSVGGKKLSDTLTEWTAETGAQTPYADGVRSETVLTNDKKGIRATVVSVYYDATATFEWTVYVKNTGAARSETLSGLYPLRASLDLSSPTLYFSGGSYEKSDDFALYSKSLSSRTITLDTVGGRTSKLYLPFFNVCDETGGATIGLGWSGDWRADFTAEERLEVALSQGELEGYLEPNEEVRSPLVSVHFYTGNPLKGFNTFRERIADSLPEGYSPVSTCFFVGAEGQDDTTNATESGSLAILAKCVELGIADKIDYAWFDAGWYDTKGIGSWYEAIGDWIVDSAKYPSGFAPVKEALDDADVGLLLWYEPERVPMRSNLYKTVTSEAGRENWLLYSTDGSQTNCLWNMGDEDALDYLANRISASVKENGVNYFRQDFNIDPAPYWEKADAKIYSGRKGFAENKYVAGEYAFLDRLLAENEGLLIDNCASGGRRLDLEMCRRSIPLWRSDYNCYDMADLAEACQYQSYGLSLWLPYSAGGNMYADTEYEYRSSIASCLFIGNAAILEENEDAVKTVEDYAAIKQYFSKNYYPLTPCTTSEKIDLAMQFGDEKEGVILVYSRAGSKEAEKSFRMMGLTGEKEYTLTYIEGGTLGSASGERLMQGGFILRTEQRSAYIIRYKAKE